MPHRRTPRKGSFGGHIDELVTHFPEKDGEAKRKRRDERARKENLDIHALLFERAWRMERDER